MSTNYLGKIEINSEKTEQNRKKRMVTQANKFVLYVCWWETLVIMGGKSLKTGIEIFEKILIKNLAF